MHRILLVDDDEDLCHMLSCFLRQEGYHVSTATNGQIALKKFHQEVPDLILLDLMLPKIDGMEVCWRIRAFSSVPIIILSAKNRDTDVFWGLQAGADDYVCKPFDVSEVLGKVKTVLDEPVMSKSLFANGFAD